MRTFDEEHNSLVVVNELAQSTAENIDSEIKKILQVKMKIDFYKILEYFLYFRNPMKEPKIF